MGDSELHTTTYLTTRQATEMFGYSRPDSFTRAWRAHGLPIYRRAGGRLVVRRKDLGRFVVPEREI